MFDFSKLVCTAEVRKDIQNERLTIIATFGANFEFVLVIFLNCAKFNSQWYFLLSTLKLHKQFYTIVGCADKREVWHYNGLLTKL